MPIISLRRYLDANSYEAHLRQIVSLLLENIGATAVEANADECESFREDIRRIADGLPSDLPPDNLMVIAAGAAQALANYNKKVETFLASREAEVAKILSMLHNTVIDIAGEHTRSAKRLQEITQELEQTGAVSDLRILKGRLTECLNGLREETRQQKADAAVTMQKLQLTIERGRAAVTKAPDHRRDPVAKLPGRDEALAAMQAAIDSGSRQYAVVMVIKRIKMINARFGAEAGDRMLVGFREHLQTQLPQTDQLFRWIDPALVAILERPVPAAVVRIQLKRILDTRIEVTYSGEGRSVLIPISAAWLVLPLISTADAQRQIDAFIAAQTNEGRGIGEPAH